MADAGIINRDALQRLIRAIGGDLDDLKDLFDSFADDTPPLFEAMRAAARANDWPAFRRAAHTAKGAARDFGATGLAEACARLESEAGEGSVENAAGRIDGVEQAFAAAAAELERLLNSGELT